MRGGWPARVAALAAALALAGCGGGGGGSSSTSASTPSTVAATTVATSGFCADLAELRRAAGDLRGLDPSNASLDQLAEVAANLGAAWNQLRASAKSAPAGVDATALTAQWRRVLADAKQLTSGGATPAVVVTTLKADAAALKKEADALAPHCAG